MNPSVQIDQVSVRWLVRTDYVVQYTVYIYQAVICTREIQLSFPWCKQFIIVIINFDTTCTK